MKKILETLKSNSLCQPSSPSLALQKSLQKNNENSKK